MKSPETNQPHVVSLGGNGCWTNNLKTTKLTKWVPRDSKHFLRECCAWCSSAPCNAWSQVARLAYYDGLLALLSQKWSCTVVHRISLKKRCPYAPYFGLPTDFDHFLGFRKWAPKKKKCQVHLQDWSWLTSTPAWKMPPNLKSGTSRADLAVKLWQVRLEPLEPQTSMASAYAPTLCWASEWLVPVWPRLTGSKAVGEVKSTLLCWKSWEEHVVDMQEDWCCHPSVVRKSLHRHLVECCHLSEKTRVGLLVTTGLGSSCSPVMLVPFC